MAVQDLRGASYPGNYGVQQEGLKGQEYTVTRFIDTTVTPLTSGDDYKVMTIGAGVMLTDLLVNVTTVEGAAETVDVGDSSSATTFHSNLSLNSAAITQTTAFRLTPSTSDNDIRIHADAAITAAKFWIIAKFIRLI